MLIAQISDPHVLQKGELLSDQVDTCERLRRCVECINQFKPAIDIVIASGDLIHNGTIEEYQSLKDILSQLNIPIYLIPGNHDDRDNLRQVFNNHDYFEDNEFLHYAIEKYPIRLIGLDTLIPGEMGGELCEKRLAWLERKLSEEPEKPTIIFMHHPPFDVGIVCMDLINCANKEGLEDIVLQHPQVLRVLSGHVHRHISVRFANTVGIVAPSSATQLSLELSDISPDIIIPWSEHEIPAFLLHYWKEGAGFITHSYGVK